MRDKTIIIAFLLSGILALAACSASNNIGQSAEKAQENGSGSTGEVSAEMPNPWTETTDPEEAKKATGIDISLPGAEAIPEGLSFVNYRYTEDVLEAVYEGGGNQLVIRASSKISDEGLTGDYNEYMKDWDEDIGGSIVHCKGDGTRVNSAYADVRGVYLAVLYNVGEEGRGLDKESLEAVFTGIRATSAE